jgi:hypothetical protein
MLVLQGLQGKSVREICNEQQISQCLYYLRFISIPGKKPI